jgi:hypothetical protein
MVERATSAVRRIGYPLSSVSMREELCAAAGRVESERYHDAGATTTFPRERNVLHESDPRWAIRTERTPLNESGCRQPARRQRTTLARVRRFVSAQSKDLVGCHRHPATHSPALFERHGKEDDIATITFPRGNVSLTGARTIV